MKKASFSDFDDLELLRDAGCHVHLRTIRDAPQLNIPFEFVSGTKAFPPGEYTVIY